MIYESKKSLFARAQLAAWRGGHLTSQIDNSSLQSIWAELRETLTSDTPFTLHVNCKGISTESTSRDVWGDLVSSFPNARLVLQNCHPSLRTALLVKLGDVFKNSKSWGHSCSFWQTSKDFYTKDDACKQVEHEFVRKALKKCFVDFSSRRSHGVVKIVEGMGLLRSTKMWTSGYFDATRLVGDPLVFPWVIGSLADSVERLIDEVSIRTESDIRLLACTRNGAVLAAAVRNLLQDVENISLDVVERFAPANEPIEFYDGSGGSRTNFINPGQRFETYVYVGDFVVGGTELKLAGLHGLYRGVPLAGAAVLGNVLDTGLLTHDYGAEALTPTPSRQPVVTSLFSLTEVEPKLKYRFPSV